MIIVYCDRTSCRYCDEVGECQRTVLKIQAGASFSSAYCASVSTKKLAKSDL